MSRNPRPCSVVIHDANNEAVTHFIMGGCLGVDEAWVPRNLLKIDEEFYLPLSKRDTRLAAFCGKSLKFNSYLDLLMSKRNGACLQILESIAKERDEADDKEAVVTKNRKKLLSSHSPLSINLNMPCADNPTALVDIPVLFESDAKVSVAMQLSEKLLDHLREAIAQSSAGDRGKKRPALERFETGEDTVRWNYQRESCYITYVDGDGRKHTKHSKPKFDHRSSSPEKQEAIQICCAELGEFFRMNHHGADLEESANSPDSEELIAPC